MSTIPLLDCRLFADFCQAHHRNACSIPVAELPGRMHELPKNTEPLLVCGDETSLMQAIPFLTSKGYRVADKIFWTNEYAARLQAEGKLETGAGSQRMWQPAPLIARFVAEFMPEYAIKPGKGLDIACGAGRDTVFLAMHGWEMTGVDYIPGALERVQQLAASQQVNVTTWLRDLETRQDPFADVAEASFDLVCVARYLHRPLFPWLKRVLKPGGIIIYQTFMQGAEQFGSPRNPNFLLKPGELAGIFSDARILLDMVEYLDDERPVSAFIARC